MTEGPAHISAVLIQAFGEVAGARGRFRGIRLSEFIYPDFQTAETTLFGYRLPFEDCGTFALGDAVQARRFVVPDMLLAMPDNPAREQLIKAIAGLYCAAWLDCAYASFNRCTADRSDASLWMHINELRQLLTRFDDAVNLLTSCLVGNESVACHLLALNLLAAATAKAMREAFNSLIEPTLMYGIDGLRASFIQTKFTAQQWQNHLHLACCAALGQAPEFPPLPMLEGDENSGYILRLYDLDAAQLHVSSAPQNQPGALRHAC
ncbi:MAG: hypothetical protein KJ798_02785 [Gammaproteobacteria bacterium]|uniref:Uncharacterized protein n=1 Tax=viral metagenome TaxID=1070528 RepID=A0A6M3JZ16_9ZZZZ|nr:hypothetical protein [Gammaproteobacteria bacterium]MBU0849689.1 hypothetical protein [Gammaproteobacteria bacterium]MBU1266140.1 hypothetical protein [Gammaproteobacteria bacterium]MBU1779290.1 hypothetical protein [Gammaproteobacteria bacterium]MBU2088190.1 hypothetical protein [Gammaproteobacteria bacterium]